MCEKNESGQLLTWQQVEHAVRRNFGGEDFEPITEFEKKIRAHLSDAADVCDVATFFDEFYCMLQCHSTAIFNLHHESRLYHTGSD